MENVTRLIINKTVRLVILFSIAIHSSISVAITIPQHILNIWWDCGVQANSVKNINLKFKIESKEGYSYIYIAPLGKITVGGVDMYGGVQSNLFGWKSKSDRTIKSYGSGAIFTRWTDKDNNNLSLDDLLLTDSTIVEIGSYEGNFASVRRELMLENGTYEFNLEFIHKTKSHVIASILMPNGKKHIVGGLVIPNTAKLLERHMASFLEIYSENYRISDGFNVTFHSPIVDGRRCTTSKNSIYSPKYSGELIAKRFNYDLEENGVKIRCCKF